MVKAPRLLGRLLLLLPGPILRLGITNCGSNVVVSTREAIACDSANDKDFVGTLTSLISQADFTVFFRLLLLRRGEVSRVGEGDRDPAAPGTEPFLLILLLVDRRGELSGMYPEASPSPTSICSIKFDKSLAVRKTEPVPPMFCNICSATGNVAPIPKAFKLERKIW